MARRALVRIDTTVGTVCAAAHVRGAVDLCVIDEEELLLKALGVSVGLCVAKKAENELARLNWPSTLRPSPSLALGLATDAAIVALEGNNLLLLHDILEELDSALKLHALDSVDGFTSVLRRNISKESTRLILGEIHTL